MHSLAVQTLFSAGGGIGIRVRLRGACLTAWGFESPPAHNFNPAAGRIFLSAFFCGREQMMPVRGAHKLLCARREQKGGAMFLFERSKRQKPRAWPIGVCRQANDWKASPFSAHFTIQAFLAIERAFYTCSPIQIENKTETIGNAGNAFLLTKRYPKHYPKNYQFLCLFYRLTIFSKRKNSSRPNGFSPSCIW